MLWAQLRHRMARGRLAIAAGAFSLGSIFNAGAFAYSHAIASSARGYRLAGVNWEIYGHWLEEWNKDASKIRTDVFYLVKGDGGAVNDE